MPLFFGLDMGEGAPSLSSTTTGHENNSALARNRGQNIAGHFILCRVQPVAFYSGVQAHRRAERKTIHKCTIKLLENSATNAIL